MNLFPTNELPDLPMIYLHQTSVRSQLIYTSSLLAFVLLLLALPFVKIDLTIKSPGSIQTEVGKSPIIAPISGRLTGFFLKENGRIKKGTTILTIDTFTPDQELDLTSTQIKNIDNLLRDVQTMLSRKNQLKLQTDYYQNSLAQYQAALQNVTYEIDQTQRDHDRYATLYQKKVVTTSEFEQRNMTYQKALVNRDAIEADFKQRWQNEAIRYQNELIELQKKRNVIENQRKNYSIKAPINGYALHLTNLQEGDRVYENQQIGEITADSVLLAFCYVKPAVIAQVKKGQSVRFQIDSFSYQQWGTLLGKVADISEDIMLVGNEPYFKVTCQLQRHYLKANGHIGQLKKGMTFTAGFVIATRTLFQLLSDKAEDWLYTYK